MADKHPAGLGKVEGNDRDLLRMDVVPDVEFGPVGEWKDADALARSDAGVEVRPEFRALILWIPLAGAVAEGEDSLFGSGFFFVTARAAKGCVETVSPEAIKE